jgi:hypothetical protein
VVRIYDQSGNVIETHEHMVCDWYAISKKACGSGVVRVQPSDVGTLICDRRSLVSKFLSGARLSRREEALPVKLSGLNLATPDARHRRPLKSFDTFEV